jgi:hypothetical protein
MVELYRNSTKGMLNVDGKQLVKNFQGDGVLTVEDSAAGGWSIGLRYETAQAAASVAFTMPAGASITRLRRQ